MGIYLPNGLGQTLGDSLAVNPDYYGSGNVWYVHYDTGTDSASAGDPGFPIKTLDYAVNTAAAAGDTIVLMDGHDETLTAEVTIAKMVSIIGGGKSGGKPTCYLRRAGGAFRCITFSAGAGGAQLRNVYFPSPTAANSEVAVRVQIADIEIFDCYFEQDEFADDYGLEFASSGANGRVEGCTFISTETTRTTLPRPGLGIISTMSVFIMKNCTFDGGTVGFADGKGAEFTAAVTLSKIEQISLLRSGADLDLGSSFTGYCQVTTATGSSKVIR